MILLRSRQILIFVALSLAALILLACGGNGTYSPSVGSGAAPPVITIAITPSTASTIPGGTVQFHAVVTGTSNTSVTWSVVTGGGGTISANGLYTAPIEETLIRGKTIGSGQYVIEAVSNADPTKSATATVSVAPAVVAISITPPTATTYPTGMVQFKAIVTGTTDTSVSWSVVTPNGGTISNTGLYTAPTDVDFRNKQAHRREEASEKFTIQAISNADPTKSATAVVTSENLLVTITPANPTVVEGQSVTFAASVTGSTNQVVNWYLNSGSGTIDQHTGVFTAGFKPGQGQVLAYTEAENGNFGFQEFTVVPPAGISVSITPPAIQVFFGGAPVQFTATVKGTSSQAVTWSIVNSSYIGSLSATGVYTPPGFGDPQTITVQATSTADPSKFATATVTVTST
jgi:hypothetical protein